MFLNVRVPVGKEKPTPHTLRYVSEDRELVPALLYRRPCGRGAAANRFYYEGWFHIPAGALVEPGSMCTREYQGQTYMTCNVQRKKNPKFRPPAHGWEKWSGDQELYDFAKHL